MIQVHFTDDSHAELSFLIKSPAGEANPPNLERAAELLFSALHRVMPAVRQSASGVAQAAALPSQPIAQSLAGSASWGESLAAIASLRRRNNSLYGMFGSKTAPST